MKCKYCGKEFNAHSYQQVFCSDSCRKKYWNVHNERRNSEYDKIRYWKSKKKKNKNWILDYVRLHGVSDFLYNVNKIKGGK